MDARGWTLRDLERLLPGELDWWRAYYDLRRLPDEREAARFASVCQHNAQLWAKETLAREPFAVTFEPPEPPEPPESPAEREARERREVEALRDRLEALARRKRG